MTEADRWWHMGSLTQVSLDCICLPAPETQPGTVTEQELRSQVCVCVCVYDYMALKVPSCSNRPWSHKELFSEAAHSKLLSH